MITTFKKLGVVVGVLLMSGLLTNPLQAQFTDQSESNLGDVVIRFCNDNAQGEPGEMKSLFLEAEAGEPEEVCIYINNNGPTDVDMKINFVDGTITADEGQNKACQPEGTISNFGQYVTYNDEIITVRAGTTMETRSQVTFPEGFAGLSYGCVTLMFAEDSEDESASMFNILTRRGYFIDMLVGGDINLGVALKEPPISFENVGESNQLYVYKTDTGAYKAAITIENTGNIPQEVSVVPTLSGIQYGPKTGENRLEQSIVNGAIVTEPVLEWGNDADRVPVTKRILPNQSVTFDFDLNGGFPLWKGPLNIDATITHKPIFEFVAADIFKDLEETTTLTIATEFFVMPWLPIGVVVALLLITVIATSKKSTPTKPAHKALVKRKTTKKKSDEK